uniref:RING-CH-type domain-containing protein n=1 Tax=Panagrolaimus davidi TaxID=227884 RepID=A0A914Q7S7_9BILA
MACESSSYESVFTDHSIEEYLSISSFSSTELLAAKESLSEDLQTTEEMATSLNVNNEGLATEEKQCRICFCFESESGDEKPQWITPCKCDGSMKWVHQKCFEQWIDFATVNQKQMCVFCG